MIADTINLQNGPVASLTEARIETGGQTHHFTMKEEVAFFVEAWIETRQSLQSSSAEEVAPCVGRELRLNNFFDHKKPPSCCVLRVSMD